MQMKNLARSGIAKTVTGLAYALFVIVLMS